MQNTLKNKATNAFIWDFIGKISIHASSFVISIFLARLLEPSDFGLIGIAMAMIGLAWSVADMGLSSALIQRKRVLSIHYASVFFINIFIASLLTLLSYFLAPSIASFYEDNRLVLIVEFISVYFIISSIASVHITILKKQLRFKDLAKASFLSSLIGGTLGVVLALNGFGVWSLIFQQFVSLILNSIFVYRKSRYQIEAKFSFKALRQLWKFGFRMFLSSLLDNIFQRIDLMIIAKLFSPATLGFFQRAKALDTMITSYSSGSIMSVLFPVLSKIKNDLPRFINVTLKALHLISLISFFLLGLFFLVSKELILLLFGDKWLISVGFFQVLVLVSFVYPLSALLVSVLSSRGNSKAFLRLEIYKKIILTINLSVGFIWGIYGYLYGLVLVYLLSLYLNIYFVSIELKLSKWTLVKPIFTQLVLTVICVLLVKVLNINIDFSDIIMLLIKSLEFMILYLFLNHIFKVSGYIYLVAEVKAIFKKNKKS